MAQSRDQIVSAVEALKRRVEALEAAVKRDATAPPLAIDVRLAQMQALDEYYRRESVEQMAAFPDLLATARGRRAKINAFLEERGLPPQPDPYHELP